MHSIEVGVYNRKTDKLAGFYARYLSIQVDLRLYLRECLLRKKNVFFIE